ncbi:hypothetical protein NSQ82_18940 [Caldifermentibacillus hisashii]|uniref:hypothetical protein n=1 Tax=Caldifermentibacillus hisashii TaxID=996558 RepID=UPI0031B6C342
MTTRSFLVTILGRETPFFSDEILSRHHFGAGNSIFGDGPLLVKLHFLATRPVLVETLFFHFRLFEAKKLFGDASFFGVATTLSRRHFEVLVGKNLFFDDVIFRSFFSRHHFGADPFSSNSIF